MKQISPKLEFEDKKIMLITHDECIFYSNDRRWQSLESYRYVKKEMDAQ